MIGSDQMIGTVRLICLAISFSAFTVRAVAEDFCSAIHAYLQHCVEAEKRDVGVAVGIVVGIVDENGSRIVSCGSLDNGTGREVDGDTVFEIGSVTKTFTTLLLEDMIARGQMQLDEPVATYLPRSVKTPTRNGKEITLRHLATHTSGLPEESDNIDSRREYNPLADYTAENLYAFLSTYRLNRDPGEKFEYSNPGIALLAQAIVLKAREDYESLLTKRICRPLKMGSTRITVTPDLNARLAFGHGATGYVVPGSEFGAFAPVGGIRSTAKDMLKYLAANLALTPSGLTPLMQRTHNVQVIDAMPGTGMGLAWATSRDPQGTEIVLHTGGTYGHLAFAGLDKSRRRGVVVLCNSRGLNDLLGLGSFLLKSQWQTDRRPLEAKTARSACDSYVGQYERSRESVLRRSELRGLLLHIPKASVYAATGFCLAALAVLFRRVGSARSRATILGCAALVCGLSAGFLWVDSSVAASAPPSPGIAIRREGERIFVQATGSRSWPADAFLPPIEGELLPESETVFFERLSGTPMIFSRDSRGTVTGLTARCGGEAFSYEKTSNEPPKAPELPKRPVAIRLDGKLLDACAGRYEFAASSMFPKGIEATISREGEQLMLHERGENAVPGAISIYPASETEFFTKIDPVRLTFVKDNRGPVTAVIFRAAGLPDYKGKKTRKGTQF